MSIYIYIFLGVLFVVTLLLTLYAFLQEEKKMKQYEEEGDTIENELNRSHEYEKNSIRTYIPIQVWIYVVFFILLIGGFIFYLYFYV